MKKVKLKQKDLELVEQISTDFIKREFKEWNYDFAYTFLCISKRLVKKMAKGDRKKKIG